MSLHQHTANWQAPTDDKTKAGYGKFLRPKTPYDIYMEEQEIPIYREIGVRRVQDLPRKPAYLLGAGAAHWHRQISSMPDLTVTAATESGQRAFAMAGLGPKDVDVLELYDAFTINTLLFLEDLGFCRKGEGGAFVSKGRIAPGGELPVNTNGGGLSCVHPGMYGIFLLVEAVRQLRGEAGARQVQDAQVALAHGNGGVLSSQITALLGTEATL